MADDNELTQDDLLRVLEHADMKRATRAEQAAAVERRSTPQVAPSLLDDWTPPIPLPDDPAENPAWDTDHAVTVSVPAVPNRGRTALARIRDAAMQQLQEGSSGLLSDLAERAHLDHLDQFMFDLRVRGVSHAEIARRLGGRWTEEDVRLRVLKVAARVEDVTTSEVKALQWARLEKAINALVEQVERGDLEAIDMWLKALERANKMAGLEQERLQVEVRIVNEHSAQLILGLVEQVVSRLRPYLPKDKPEIIDAVVDETLEQVQEEVQRAQRPVAIDPKTGELLP